MKILRTKLIAVAEALGCPTAARWNKPKAISRIKDLAEAARDAKVELEDPGLQETWRRLQEAVADGTIAELQVVDDMGKPEVAAAFRDEAVKAAEPEPEASPASEAAEPEDVAEPVKAKAKKARKEPATEAKVKKEKRASPLTSVLTAIKNMEGPVTKAELAEAAWKLHQSLGGDERQDANVLLRYLPATLHAAEVFGIVSVRGDQVIPIKGR